MSWSLYNFICTAVTRQLIGIVYLLNRYLRVASICRIGEGDVSSLGWICCWIESIQYRVATLLLPRLGVLHPASKLPNPRIVIGCLNGDLVTIIVATTIVPFYAHLPLEDLHTRGPSIYLVQLLIEGQRTPQA